jgi:hypothetical protein
MKTAFQRLIGRRDMAEERLVEVKDMTIKIFKTEE